MEFPMTMQIRAAGTSPSEHASRKASDRASPMRDLGKALKSGDLAAASAAYATLASKAPERVTQSPDSPFAKLGAALASGDLAAARSAYGNIFTSHLPQRGDSTQPVSPSSASSANPTTAASTGALLDISV
jgi:hypothetical protein